MPGELDHSETDSLTSRDWNKSGAKGRLLKSRILTAAAVLLISISLSPLLITTADEGSTLDSDPGVLVDDAPANVQAVDFAVRIAARLTTDQRIEFGIQLLDRNGVPGALLLPEQRFFPLATSHHDWLRSPGMPCRSLPYNEPRADLDEELLYQFKTTIVQLRARVHPTRQLVEFALRHELPVSEDGPAYSDPLFPKKRFFPSNVGHHNWLYSSDIEFTILYGAEGYMDAPASMESVDGPIQPHWTDIYEYRDQPRDLSECLSELDDEGIVFLNHGCIIPMIRHCKIDREIVECRNFRRHWPQYAIAIDIDESKWP